MRKPNSLFGRARRRCGIALVTAALVGVALAVSSQTSVATASTPKPTPSPHSGASHILHMGTYTASSFAAAAKKLPGGLTTALLRDVHLTGEQYLADSAAALQAVKVVSSLKAAGISVLGSHMKGSKLFVNIRSSADSAAVTATGATAVIGAPPANNYAEQTYHTVSTSNTYGGEGYFYQEAGQKDGSGFRCSIGFNGYSVSTGSPQFATAGHCATTMHGNAYPIDLSAPTGSGGTGDTNTSTPLGGMVSGEGKFGSDNDYGIVAENPSLFTPQPALYTWGNSTSGAPLSSAPLTITGESKGVVGATLCKSGSSSGWTCGTITAVDVIADVVDDNNVGHSVNTIVASTCLLPGDSGGGAVVGQSAVGINSGSDNVTSNCTHPLDSTGHAATSVFFPMMSDGGNSLDNQQGTHWQIAIPVTSTPTVSSPASGATVYSYTSMTGTLTSATASSTVLVYWDGAKVPKKYTATTGAWTIPLSGLAVGTHTYVVAGGSGWSPGPTVSGTITIAAANRIGGVNRYDTGVLIAQSIFPHGGPIPVLYIANGLNYPDGLSAAPAVAKQGGAMLLTSPTSLPTEVRDEIETLAPERIVVVGGTPSVSAAEYNELATLVADPSDITREGGSTRYGTSQEIASAFSGHIDTIFLANGGNFPDALSESAAAAKEGSPVILVPGTKSQLDDTTLSLIASFTPTTVVIAGSSASVSTGIQNQLAALYTVERLGGADRYQTAHLINSTFFPSATVAIMATGAGFPDALAGGVIAAANSAPLMVVPPKCVEPYDLADLVSAGVTSVTLLGGTPSLSAAVANFTACT